MNLSSLSNQELHRNTISHAMQERASMTAVLFHLKEINDRRLYSEMGYDSIFSYAVRELKYSEAAAARRVNAMRVLSAVPQVASEIENGSLSLSAVSSAQSFFKKEAIYQKKKYTAEEKREVLSAMVNKSSKECEKVLAAISPDSAVAVTRRDLAKPVTENLTELRFTVDQETMKKFEKVLSLLSHQNHSGAYGKALELLCEIALDKLDPERKEARIQARKKKTLEKQEAPVSAEPVTPAKDEIHAVAVKQDDSENSGYISAPMRRQVLIRDRYRCKYVNPETGEVCGSTWKVEPDHIIPIAMGGKSIPLNLISHCRNHNLWTATVQLGAEKMSKYIVVKDGLKGSEDNSLR